LSCDGVLRSTMMFSSEVISPRVARVADSCDRGMTRGRIFVYNKRDLRVERRVEH
jgi:hypothetical protein